MLSTEVSSLIDYGTGNNAKATRPHRPAFKLPLLVMALMVVFVLANCEEASQILGEDEVQC
jgi:hypothetical protein